MNREYSESSDMVRHSMGSFRLSRNQVGYAFEWILKDFPLGLTSMKNFPKSQNQNKTPNSNYNYLVTCSRSHFSVYKKTKTRKIFRGFSKKGKPYLNLQRRNFRIPKPPSPNSCSIIPLKKSTTIYTSFITS